MLGNPERERDQFGHESPDAALSAIPVSLKNNRRIEARFTVICLRCSSLSLSSELSVSRSAPVCNPPGYGTTARQAGRAPIFAALSHLRLMPATDASPARIPRPPRPGCSSFSTSTPVSPAGN